MRETTVEEKISDELLTVAARAAYYLVYGPAEPWDERKLHVLREAIGSGYRKEAIRVVERELTVERLAGESEIEDMGPEEAVEIAEEAK